jgi:alkanesulfonate monooxygenase SsuD/methylene tetrahydromethanopterin reductase-like flavin-dependent oxidoreductase (luciferase family)
MTSILLAPLRANHTEFAKQAASVNALSDGRLVLGLAVGGREDDYTESGLPFDRRGADLDALLARATEVWGATRTSGSSRAPRVDRRRRRS